MPRESRDREARTGALGWITAVVCVLLGLLVAAGGAWLWMRDGSRSARACLARRWGVTVGAAGERLLVAARLREAPATRGRQGSSTPVASTASPAGR